MLPREHIARALARPARSPALVAFFTAGHPQRAAFLPTLRAVASAADAVEVGVPFSDPMADGVTIQRASEHAIAQGVSLQWILDELTRRDFELAQYLSAVKAATPLPVCAGFGVRTANQVETIGRHADGVIVGSALVEALERGADPVAFLQALRPR